MKGFRHLRDPVGGWSARVCRGGGHRTARWGGDSPPGVLVNKAWLQGGVSDSGGFRSQIKVFSPSDQEVQICCIQQPFSSRNKGVRVRVDSFNGNKYFSTGSSLSEPLKLVSLQQ